MFRNYFKTKKSSFLLLTLVIGLFINIDSSFGQINFSQSALTFENGDVGDGVTSLMYGPDSRLYVAEYTGAVKILTIQRNGPTNYVVTQIEELDGIQTMADHNDDGSEFLSTTRETIGLTVGGTAISPVIYVSSSDIRIGAGTGGGNGDVGLDTNSGVITRFSWNGSSWDVVDLVRGLPRSEENHATNGLELVTIQGVAYLVVAQGGHTNGGSPSTNFVNTCEYALSGAILSMNLDMLNSMPIIDDNGRSYVYDLPTLDDPTRDNVNGITDSDNASYTGLDINDPFGGNDGLNMAIVDPSGPVQILSPGYRNAYDLVVTQSGALYVTDNGANLGWGGLPFNEGGGSVTNAYDPNEPGSTNNLLYGEQVNNKDHLQLVTTDLQNYTFGSYYGGHPNPVRANPFGAGLYTDNISDLGTTGNPVWRDKLYDPDGTTPNSTTDPNSGLPANWPPVQTANTIEGDWRGPGIGNPDGPDDDPVVVWGTNTNGIDEYTASNFGGAMKGNLLAGTNGGVIRRVELNDAGGSANFTASFLSGIGGNALGITSNGDDEVYPGTIWAGTLDGKIVVFEPQEIVNCIAPTDPLYDALADYDDDGYTNQDEEDNGTDPCNGGSQPADFDKTQGAPLVSDLNDTDDDFDGISDALDPFQLGNSEQIGSDAFLLPLNNALFNDQQGLGGIFGLGMTGLMNNGDTGANWLDWIDRRDDPNDPNPNDVLGGAPGIMTSHMTSGTALGLTNSQEKGYQYGIQTDINTGVFTVVGGMNGFTGPLRLYGNTAAVGGELGFFIGDGTQSNYIKFVVTVDGFIVLQETDDIPKSPLNMPLPIGDRPSGDLFFYFVINPLTGDITMQYAIDGGARTSVGTITAQGSILDAIQQSNSDLAVGFIGTSGTDGVELEGSWDFLNVLDEKPIVVENISDIRRLLNSADDVLDLNIYFEDDNGDGNLSYAASSSNPLIGAVVNLNELTVSYPSTAETSVITVTAIDSDDNSVEQSFLVEVTGSPIVLYRVNTGGPKLTSVDGGLDWEEDTVANNSQYLIEPAGNKFFASTISSYTPAVNSYTTPSQIFESERYDNQAGIPNMTYSFPVAVSGNYEVRVYMGNSFAETSNLGERIFDVELEGNSYPELSSIDLSGTYGQEVGTMITYILPVLDGIIDISFIHGAIENPLVNGIEILDVSDNQTPIYVHGIENQISNAGQQLNGSFGVQALGGDGNLTFSATGLPSGVTIEPTNGQIGGTIDETAIFGSPYSVTITVDDSDADADDQKTLAFTWTIFDAFSFRINAGGPSISVTDIGSSWEDNSVNGPQNGGNYAVNTGTNTTAGLDFKRKDASIPAYINLAIFDAMYGNERYDVAAVPEMEYALPLDNGDYLVNIYLSNSFAGTDQIGERVFDILIEGVIEEDDLDLIAKFGHQVAGMVSYPISVSDGELNISFAHEIENPVINAIEVFKVDNSNPILSLDTISDQSNDTFDTVSIATSAVGGDPNEIIRYYMTGQPDGLVIDELTGEISGSITSNALTGGANGNGVHSVTVTVLKRGSSPSSVVFTWTVIGDGLFWTDLDENENYTARHENSFVQAGNKFYLMGGRENAKTIDVYDYTSNTWASLVDSSPFEFNHFQATEYKGLIWVIGAFQNNVFPSEVPADHIWAFDTSTSEWIQGPEIPMGRRRGSSGLVIHNDKFYIVGGNTIGHDGGYVNWFDEYDPATGIWTPLVDAPNARDHFSAAVIDNNLYATGGRLSGGTGGVYKPTVPEVDVFDFTTATWSTLPAGQNIPTPRGAASTVNFDNKLVVIGGEVLNELVYGVNTDDALKITEQYDPSTGTWSRLPDMNFERHGSQAIVSGQGIFTLAGSPKRGGGNQKNMEVFGINSPQGSAVVASDLNAPSSILIASGTTETITLDVVGGNVAKMIRSIQLGGPDAADFSIVAGSLSNALLNANTSYDIVVQLNNDIGNKSAILTVNYGATSTLNIALSNTEDTGLSVANPGTQNNNEQDVVSLQINTTGGTGLTYGATGLPPTLSIDSSTGLISGTVSDGGAGDGSFMEENGLVVVEAESGNSAGWGTTALDGATGIIANTNSFTNQNGSTIPYQITIGTPGVYRFNWRSLFSGTDPTEENDNWLSFPNNDDVWFFGLKGTPTNEAAIINNLQGAQTNIVFPGGTTRQTAATTPEGSSSNEYFKIYRSDGTSESYNWQARTSDNDNHEIYVWFVNPGTYTMDISERSSGHAIDKFALYKVDTFGATYDANLLTNTPQSPLGGGGAGAADNGPYNVEVTVVTGENPPTTETIEFIWNIGQVGDQAPVAVASATPLTGNAPLQVQFTGSNSTDAVGVTSYSWNFDGGTPDVSSANPSHTFMAPGVYNVQLTVGNAAGLTNSTLTTITVESGVVNQAPVVTNPAEQNGVEGDVVSLQVVANDPEGDGLTYSATNLPTGLSIDTASGLISGTITMGAATNSPYAVDITVTDDGTPSELTTVSFTWNVTDVPVNLAPVVTNPGEQNGVEDNVVSLQVTATDPEDDDMTYSATNLPTGLSIDMATGLISGTITMGAATNSPYAVDITVTDDGTPSEPTTVSFTWNVTDVRVNLAPVVTNPGGQNGVEGDVVSLQVTATDPEDDGMTYSATNLPTGLSIDMATGLISGTITRGAAANSPYAVDIMVTDDGTPSEPTTVSFTWNVTDVPVNFAPVVTNPGEQNGVEDNVVSLQVTATDSEDDDMTYSATNLPTGLSIDMATGLISGTITRGAAANSPYAVDIMVTDDGTPSESTTVSFTWTITDVPSNPAPVAIVTSSVVSGTSPLTVTFTGSNSTDDKEIISYMWDFGTGDTSSIPNPEYTFEFAGIFEVNLTVSDEEGLTDITTLIIQVEENETFDATMDNMVISPNPASEFTKVYINLEVPAPLLGIYVYDSSGRLVKQYDYFESYNVNVNANANGNYDIFVGDLRNGIYTVYAYITDTSEPLVKKMIVLN
ncbi:putative Ig domain-containing protein [Maribacter sp. ACAM166]|uniref:putative Ig domain-containing protein n=1 Tax=Maribacter sp. ACAM166 TaxID=2508996 RepID=UPI0010FF148F|nr:putative Ig domain-containing protein [Maribacter sp. ACAM166]TLP77561.1 PKD domain-containing protein [Maribacter sp. ACAM166]